MNTTKKFALAAVATALMGTTAFAADLGGSCCADLEERIAELEATTVRKGNRKVSVQISGFVGHQVMFWDDGARSDTYIGDGGNIFSRWRLRGSAKINSELSAGFLYEFGLNNNSIAGATQQMGTDGSNNGDDLGGPATGFASIRDETVWLKHNRLGMIKIGHGSTSTDNLVLIDLGNRSAAGTPDVGLYQGAFRLTRNGEISGEAGSGIAAVTWNDIFRGGEGYDTTRRNHVLYESPALAGFTLQAAVAEDNYWDVALRYAGEFNGVRVAFGIGYQENSEFNHTAAVFPSATSCPVAANCEQSESQFKGSASILHVPTGLFLTGAWGTKEVEQKTSLGVAALNTDSDSGFWHLAGGVNKNFFGIGNTVLFAEYTEATDSARHIFADVLSSKGTQWGLGINQYVDAAAMQIFLTYKHFEADINTTTVGKIDGLGDFSTVLAGMRIDF
jgi:predicted porin